MNLFKSKFSKNVITLITGTTIAQAIPVIISPILTRIYTPADIGVLSLFTTISIIFGNISNAKYELAIVLPDEDTDAIYLVALSILISAILSIILFIIVLFFNEGIANFLNNQEIKFWLYFIPIVVFLYGLFNSLINLNIRIGSYSRISKSNIYKSLTASVFQIFLGLIISGSFGLISGNILSYIPSNIELSRINLKFKLALKNLHISGLRKVGKTFIKFPKFTLSASAINIISRYAPNIFISSIYSSSYLGFYSIINRVLNMPLLLIGNSIGQVFTKVLAEKKRMGGNSKKIFDETLIKLFLISLPFFLILFFTIEDIFRIVFGKNWTIAGYYCKILLPVFFMRFIAIPLSITMEIFSRQIYNLIWQLGLLIINALIFIFTIIYKLNFTFYLVLTSACLSIYYFLNLLLSRKSCCN